MPNEQSFMRMDFDIEYIEDKETGRKGMLIYPDKNRYEFKTMNGKEGYLDKEACLFIPLKIVKEMIQNLHTIPGYYQPHNFRDLPKYISDRKAIVEEALVNNADVQPIQLPIPTEHLVELNSIGEQQVYTSLIYADLVSSTSLSSRLEPADYARLISIVRNELLAPLPCFHGAPLKTGGDSVMAYFAAPSANSKNDLAIDCALAMRLSMYYVLNPLFEKHGFPKIDVCIALDFGKADVISDINQLDIVGHFLNRLKRIQEIAKPGEVLIGMDLFNCLHQSWRERCELIDPGSKWDEVDKHGTPYKIFRVTN